MRGWLVLSSWLVWAFLDGVDATGVSDFAILVSSSVSHTTPSIKKTNYTKEKDSNIPNPQTIQRDLSLVSLVSLHRN